MAPDQVPPNNFPNTLANCAIRQYPRGMTTTTGGDPRNGMTLLVDEPTTTLTKGEMAIETDSFTLETPAGNFRFYLRADGAITLSGDRVAVRADGRGVLVLETQQEASQ